MTNIYDEIIHGKVDLLFDLTDYDRKNFIVNIIGNSSRKKEILNGLLPIFINAGWYGLGYEIFCLIYLDNDFKEYTFYLLHNNYVKIMDLNQIEIKNILENTSWGFDYILDNLNKCFENDKMYEIINTLVEYAKADEAKLKILTTKILSFNDSGVRYDFILAIINQHIKFDTRIFLACLYQNTDDYYFHQETLPFCEGKLELINSKLPNFLLFHANKDATIHQIMLENFELFFNAEATSKMKLLDYFYSDLDQDIVNKYTNIYKLYLKQPTLLVDKYLSILINNNLLDWINNLIGGRELSYLTSGSTTSVFKIDNLVLKFSLQKHEINTVKDLFLISPTEEIIIYDDCKHPKMIIEVQKYLQKSYNGQNMTKDDINNYLFELEKQGFCVTDPNCLNRNFDNFGFLNDYHDANLGDFYSHEELPEWFKLRPIVLYDVDLVYKKDYEKKKNFKL